MHLHASVREAACSTRMDSERYLLSNSGTNAHKLKRGAQVGRRGRVCRAVRSLQPFAMACAAGPCPRRRQRLTNGLASSFQTYAPAYVELEAAEQRTTGSKHLLQMTLL